ncbi:hypothetical protein [Bartonella heixiaziensis]|uniref:hypothetical protein n=1 Tax=Bartonella heixiaziensis TaxID=1461000 RepID=UPI003D24F111
MPYAQPLNYAITCLSTLSTIACDWPIVKVKGLLINLEQENFSITRGMRIAQPVIAPVIQVNICEIEQNQQDSSQTPDKAKTRGVRDFDSTEHDLSRNDG